MLGINRRWMHRGVSFGEQGNCSLRKSYFNLANRSWLFSSIDVTSTKRSIRNFFLQYSDDAGPVYPRLLEQVTEFFRMPNELQADFRKKCRPTKGDRFLSIWTVRILQRSTGLSMKN
jgi:hypothetical protein